MGKAALDKPENQEIVLSQIHRQHGLETGVWDLAGIKESTYYQYKKNHPEFAAKVQEIRKSFEKPHPPHTNLELRKIADDLLEKYLRGGCKTTRWQRIMQAIPLFNEDKTPKLDAKGQQEYRYVIEKVIETIYDNGINFKAYEKVYPEDIYSEKSLKFIVASQFQHIQENITDQDEQHIIVKWLKKFKDDFYVEMAAITGYTPKPKKP